jgi:acyl carrier protein
VELLALALERESVHLVALPLQLRRVGEELRSGGEVPAVWRKLVRPARNRKEQPSGTFPDPHAPLSREEHHARVTGIVRKLIAQVLGLRSPSDVGANRPLQELGLDSIMAAQLRNRLATAFSAQLRVTVLFEYPTVERLTRYLLDDVLQIGHGEAPHEGAQKGSGDGAWEEGSL